MDDTNTITQSLGEIIKDAKRIDSLSYDEVLYHAQQRGTASLLSMASQALTTPIQTATGEGFFTDIVVEWGSLNGHADASRLLVEKVFRFTAAVKSLRQWANSDEWLADDGREDLIERRIALGELTQELIRFAESFGRTISRPGAAVIEADPETDLGAEVAKAVAVLSESEGILLNAIHGSKFGMTYRELAGVSEAYRDGEIAIETAARTKISRVRKALRENGILLEIFQAKKSGPLVIQKRSTKVQMSQP